MPTIKVIEVIGVSDDSWEDAAAAALKEATKTVRNITGLDVVSQTAKIKDGKISEFHTACKLAFKLD